MSKTEQQNQDDAAKAAAEETAKAEAAKADKKANKAAKGPEAPAGSVRLKHPGGVVAASWNGIAFNADADGFFIVPADAVGELVSHGFVPA